MAAQLQRDQATYVCEVCGGEFEFGWSDDEAKAELAETFPGIGIEECGTVCDDCFKKMGLTGDS